MMIDNEPTIAPLEVESAVSHARFEDSRRWRRANPSYELPRMRPLAHVPKAISFHLRNGVLEALRGINMAHQAHKGLPEPGDYRPQSWRDVVGLLMALVGLALVVGMTLTM
jgi:hypothetical protein